MDIFTREYITRLQFLDKYFMRMLLMLCNRGILYQ